MFYQKFFWAQVKRCTIISDKHGKYELPRELSNCLRLRISGILEISGKSQNFMNATLLPSLPAKTNIFLTLPKDS